MNGLPLASRSTSGNGSGGRFKAPFGSISSEAAASPSGSPTARRACRIGSGSPSALTARSGRAACRARSSEPAASIIRLETKRLAPAGGSSSASAVIETRTARPMHHGAATERAHGIRDRPIRDQAPHTKEVSRMHRARLKRPAQCESFRLSALKVAGGLPWGRAAVCRFGAGAPRGRRSASRRSRSEPSLHQRTVRCR